jgi:subtilase-type serine protease
MQPAHHRYIPAAVQRQPYPSRSRLAHSLLLAMMLGAAQPVLAQSSNSDTESWMDEEFKADWGLQAINAQHAYARGLSGKGVQLGIFDSGVATGHDEFSGKSPTSIHMADPGCTSEEILAGPDACFASDGGTAAISNLEYTERDKVLIDYMIALGYLRSDVEEIIAPSLGAHYTDHGTHVAGTMLANRDGNGSHGVAWGANLTTARLFANSSQNVAAWLSELFGADLGEYFGLDTPSESLGIGPSSEAKQAMYQQMAASGVRAINHSWGLSNEPSTLATMDAMYQANSDYLKVYVDGSLNTGMLQVFAAGNGSGNIAGIYASLPRYVPELEKYWLSVVNINQTGKIDDSSSICAQSKQWCVTAPGSKITSSIVDGDIDSEILRDAEGKPIGMRVVSRTEEHGYGNMTGTSMAAPHVTGALGLLFERFPYLDSAQVRDVLLTTATDIGAPGVDAIYGWGLINLQKAIDGPGSLRVDTDVVMNQRAGGNKVWSGDAWDDWSNDISGPGKLTKDGIGWLRLSGDNSFAGASVRGGILELSGANQLAGAVSVDGNAILSVIGSLDGSDVTINQGAAVVNGQIRNGTTTVASNGRLSGNGTLADTVVAGTIAPGNSIGTLTIDGDYVQQAGSVYAAEVDGSGADLLLISGKAVLQGGTLRLITPSSTSSLLGNSYSLLEAGAGISGTFSTLDSSGFSTFLQAKLSYLSNALNLDILRGASLASAATTANQTAVATAIDSHVDSDSLLQRMLMLSEEQARSAFDSISGEIHASAKSLLLQDSQIVRDAALTRARNSRDAFTAQRDADAGVGAWAQVTHGNSRLDGNANAAQARLSGNTTLVGADLQLDNGLRLGLLGGGGRADLNVSARSSKAKLDSTHAGFYASQQWQGFGLRLGYSQGWHELDSERKVNIGTLNENAHAKYDARSRQAFVEAAYHWNFAKAGIEPFVQYAQVRVKTDSASEQGGLAALSLKGDTQKANFGTAGLRVDTSLAGTGQQQNWLNLHATLAYRRASGDTTPTALATLSGDGSFSVDGTALARNATIAEIGLAARLSPNSLFEVGYNGLFAGEAHDAGVNARFSVQF